MLYFSVNLFLYHFLKNFKYLVWVKYLIIYIIVVILLAKIYYYIEIEIENGY